MQDRSLCVALVFLIMFTVLGMATLEAQLELSAESSFPDAPPELAQMSREDGPQNTNLVLFEPDGAQRSDSISGFHRFAGRRLYFEGHRAGNEEATVLFWSDDGSLRIESRILSRTEGWIRLDGIEVSGRGLLEKDDRDLLDRISSSVIGEQLALLPLELGCRLYDQGAAPLLAAAVQPWQILYKYTGRLRADAATLPLSGGCSYLSPAPGRRVVLDSTDPVAHVPLFLTLDDEGADLRAMLSASTAPCGAKCRGACGADCTSPLCSLKSSGCEYVCPTHSFCRWHDSCYDSCNSIYGCYSITGWLCKRNCDDQCLQWYSETTCAAWSQGLGPSDGWGTYDECGGFGGGGGDDGSGGGSGDGGGGGGCAETETCVDCPLANCDNCTCDTRF